MTADTLNPYDENAVAVKAKKGSQERVVVKVSTIQVERTPHGRLKHLAIGVVKSHTARTVSA